MTLALFNVSFPNKGFWLAGSIVSIFTGIVVYANRTYLNKPAGIKTTVYGTDFTNRGNWAWMMGVILTTFYIVLYWYPEYLGLNQDGGNSKELLAFLIH
jgi:hypothetical protein